MAEGAYPEHGAEPPLLPSPMAFECSTIYKHFKSKLTHFLTIKCNRGQRFQTLRQVRTLVSRCYDSFVIVGSPKGGRHWHVMATGLKKTLKVPRGVHYHKATVGRLSVSYANRRPHEDPCKGDSSLYSQLRHAHMKVAPSVTSGARINELAAAILYLFSNLLENPTKDKENLWTCL